MIHQTAIIDKTAEIGENVQIGPFSIIKNDVTIGAGSIIESHAVIEPYVKIGEKCRIYQFASVGGVPQDLKFKGEKSYLEIGSGTIIRECVTVNRGTEQGGGVTKIGEQSYLMAYVHVAHDCRIGKSVILANNATLGGHIVIGDHAIIGGLAAIHQFVKIGDHAFLGGKTVAVKDIPPYVIAAGDRATLHGLNKVGLARKGFSEETLRSLKNAYRIVFRIGLTLKEAVERVKAEVEQTPEVVKFIEFIQKSDRGLTR